MFIHTKLISYLLSLKGECTKKNIYISEYREAIREFFLFVLQVPNICIIASNYH